MSENSILLFCFIGGLLFIFGFIGGLIELYLLYKAKCKHETIFHNVDKFKL
jgi:hypothetical protein